MQCAEPGKAYALYFHVPLPKKPKKLEEHLREGVNATVTLALPAGRFEAEWVNTMTGKVEKSETFEHAGTAKELSSPHFANDIALRLTVIVKDARTPGRP